MRSVGGLQKAVATPYDSTSRNEHNSTLASREAAKTDGWHKVLTS
jgi:hypothetical protein